MKDFDVQRKERAESQGDRSFQIGGETFSLRSGIRPELIARYEAINEDTPATEVLEAFDSLIIDLIESTDDAADRWTALRAREDDPITLDDIASLVQWSIEVMTGRPTQQPSPSPRGPERTSTSSTESSSSSERQAA